MALRKCPAGECTAPTAALLRKRSTELHPTGQSSTRLSHPMDSSSCGGLEHRQVSSRAQRAAPAPGHCLPCASPKVEVVKCSEKAAFLGVAIDAQSSAWPRMSPCVPCLARGRTGFAGAWRQNGRKMGRGEWDPSQAPKLQRDFFVPPLEHTDLFTRSHRTETDVCTHVVVTSQLSHPCIKQPREPRLLHLFATEDGSIHKLFYWPAALLKVVGFNGRSSVDGGNVCVWWAHPNPREQHGNPIGTPLKSHRNPIEVSLKPHWNPIETHWSPPASHWTLTPFRMSPSLGKRGSRWKNGACRSSTWGHGASTHTGKDPSWEHQLCGQCSAVSFSFGSLTMCAMNFSRCCCYWVYLHYLEMGMSGHQ